MYMDMFVCNVGRGMSILVQTPSGHLVMIDCGSSVNASPAKLVHDMEDITPYGNSKLTHMIITHPHIDHINDIINITNLAKPAIITRNPNIDLAMAGSDGSYYNDIFQHYIKYYSPGIYKEIARLPYVDMSFNLSCYNIDNDEALEISRSSTEYTNNSSVVVCLKYNNLKYLIFGDNGELGINKLVNTNIEFRNFLIGGVDVLITPHHGHASGFPSAAFEVMGAVRKACVASERRLKPGEDESATAVDARYSDIKYCVGNNSLNRRLISTKHDGSIAIRSYDNGVVDIRTVAGIQL